MESGLQELGLGRGIYSLTEAAMLTGVSAPRIKRWFTGFEGPRADRRPVGPVLAPDYPMHDAIVQLSFLDLTEVRFIEAFLRFGVGWKELRRAARGAAEMLGTHHPFSTHRFKSDGHSIFVQVTDESGDTHLIQLRDRQQVFRRIMEPLLSDLEFGEETVCRWWPLGDRRLVKIDPTVGFGAPVGAHSHVPTSALAAQARASSVERAAAWFETDKREVRDALEFERRLAAAA